MYCDEIYAKSGPLRSGLIAMTAIALGLAGCQSTPTSSTAGEVAGKSGISEQSTTEAGDVVTSRDQEVFRTVDEAQGAVTRLGQQPTPQKLATLIAELDTWLVQPAEQKAFTNLQLKLLDALRTDVKKSVEALQKAALDAPRSVDGARKLDEAARTLALYPVSTDLSVLEEASRLSARQVETAKRLDVLRRQRYNRWAIGEIEKAINYYNENVSRWNLFNDNSALIAPMAAILGPIDPIHLEPVVLELYNYPIKKVNAQFERSEKNRSNFATQLTAPSIRRRLPGEF